MFELPMARVVLVRYRDALEMAPERQVALTEAIRSSARAGPVVVLLVADGIRWVDRSVTSFWTRLVADASAQIAAVAIVTDSLDVEVAVRRLAAELSARVRHVEVRTFLNERAATAWARRLMLEPTAPRL